MKYVLFLTLLLLAISDNVEIPEEISKMGESVAAKVSLDDQSKFLFIQQSLLHLPPNGQIECLTMNPNMFI
jgi:hypothetical protein